MKNFLITALIFISTMAFGQSISRHTPTLETDNIFVGKNQFTKGARLGPVTFSALPSDALDGTIVECSDCQATQPCVGSGSGAYAHRIGGAWSCTLGGTSNLRDGLVISTSGTAAPSPLATAEGPCTTFAPWQYIIDNNGTYHTQAAIDTTNYANEPSSPYGIVVNCRQTLFDDLDTTSPVTGHSYFVGVAHLLGGRGLDNALGIFQVESATDTTDQSGKQNSNAVYIEQDFQGAPSAVNAFSIAALRVRNNSSWNAGAPTTSQNLYVIEAVATNDYLLLGKTYVHPNIALIAGQATNNLSGGATNVLGLNPIIQCGNNAGDCAVVKGSVTGSSTGTKAMVIEDDSSGTVYGIYQKGNSDSNRMGKLGIGVVPSDDFDVGNKFHINKTGYWDVAGITDPGNPSGVFCRLYIDPSGNLSSHKSDGTACFSGGGGGTPGGSTTQVQFNSSNAFAGSANLTFVSPILKIGVAGSTTGQLQLTGATSGTVSLIPQTVAGTVTLTLPNQSGTIADTANVPIILSPITGAISCPTCALTSTTLAQFQQTTSTQLASIISDETGGTGVLVFNSSPTILTPFIASFLNAQHTHTNAANGGQLTDSALSSAVGVAKGGTNNTTSPDSDLLVGNGSTWLLVNVANCPDTGGNHLNYVAASHSFPCGTTGGGGGGANAALSNLVAVAFNADLLPDTNNTRNLGSPSLAVGSGFFGTTVQSPVFSTSTASPATSGLIRGSNNSTLVAARNAANTANCSFGLNASDQFFTDCPFTSSGAATYLELGSETSATTGSVNTARITYNDSTGKLRVSLDGAGPVTVITSAETVDALAASTSAQLQTLITDETGSGHVVFDNTPTLITPVLGVATATSINKVTLTAPAANATLTIANTKTLTVSNSLTLQGTDSTTFTLPTTSATLFGSTTLQDVLVAGSYCADAGASDTYACNLTPTITSYVTGTHYFFKANTANTGAATLNFNSLGAKTIVKYQGGVAQTLSDNDIRAGADVEVVYDGTNMQIISVLGNAAGAGTGDVTDVGDCTSAACFTSGGTGTLLVFHNATSGTVTLQTVTGALSSGTLSLPNATDTLVGKATTDTFTNKTFDTAGTGNSFSINGVAASANTGTGSVVRATSPTLVTPVLGAATATTINKLTLTAPATGSTFTLVDGKTLVVNNSLTLAGTDSTTLTFQGTDTYVGRATTDTLTNKSYDAEGTGNTLTVPSKFWIGMAGCQNATAFLLVDTPTTNPAVAACDTGTNTQKGTADFADGANSLAVYTNFMLPSDWTGAIDVRGKWFSSVTSGNVVWQVATICVADGATSDPAFNTASTATDATKGTTLQDNDFTITGITTTGCSAGNLLYLKIFRDPANASDTMAGTARLRGVEVTIRRAE